MRWWETFTLLKRIKQACEIDGVLYAEGQNVLFDDAVIPSIEELLEAANPNVGVYVSHAENVAFRG